MVQRDPALKMHPNAPRSSATRRSKAAPGAERAAPRRDVLAAEVLSKASELFARKGFAATSLQDVADAVGLSRTSIYTYFDSKDALLFALVEGVTKEAGQIFDRVDADAGLAAPGKVREAARRLVLWVTDPATNFKLVDRSENDLPKPIADAHRRSKRRVLSGLVGLIEAGVASGAFRAVEPRIAAFAILGMCNWTAWWYSPGGTMPREAIADVIADQALASLVRPADRTGTTDIRELTDAIRAELDLIDTLHGPKP